jgi:hypothetical protein
VRHLMQQCPQCTSNRIHRSRSKTFVERLRRQFSTKRLYRCQACGWRGWGIETEADAARQEQLGSELPPPDLSAIDADLEHASKPSADPDAAVRSN